MCNSVRFLDSWPPECVIPSESDKMAQNDAKVQEGEENDILDVLTTFNAGELVFWARFVRLPGLTNSETGVHGVTFLAQS